MRVLEQEATAALTSPVLIFSFFRSAYASCPAVSSISMCRGAPCTSTSLVYMSPMVGMYCRCCRC
jgi:hypothetical protein